jgi:putative Mg2+ transporter-C (MgtC) family protein
LIGLNRGEHGHAAGLRTTVLVCLAASISMIQVNLLLGLTGKASDSFVVLDLMRLPLGILSGMGFIGAGAILRRGRMVAGVTTAATLWFVTVLGLCFGGGQLLLGSIGFLLGMIVLAVFKWAELRIPQDREATLTADLTPDGPGPDSLAATLGQSGFHTRIQHAVYSNDGHCMKIVCHVRWQGRKIDERPPKILQDLARQPGISRLEWMG